MSQDTSRARDLLRIALDLLQDEDALVAAAMISGAISVLDGHAAPAAASSSSGIYLRGIGRRAEAHDYRSCA